MPTVLSLCWRQKITASDTWRNLNNWKSQALPWLVLSAFNAYFTIWSSVKCVIEYGEHEWCCDDEALSLDWLPTGCCVMLDHSTIIELNNSDDTPTYTGCVWFAHFAGICHQLPPLESMGKPWIHPGIPVLGSVPCSSQISLYVRSVKSAMDTDTSNH